MGETQSGILKGLERVFVFNRLRAAIGLRWEVPRLLDRVKIPPDSLCLEIGAGLGWGTLGLLRHLNPRQVVTTDYDGMVLPLTRSYLQARGGGSGVAFCQADARSLPFPDATFDLVLALYTFHHIPDYPQALREIARVAKQGGWFVFTDDLRLPWMPRLQGLLAPGGLASRDELTVLLAETGFHVERWRGLPFWASVAARKVNG